MKGIVNTGHKGSLQMLFCVMTYCMDLIMDVFSVIKLIGGLAFFLFGMNVLSTSLETMVGGRFESVLKKMTSNPLKGLALGTGITIAIQSSSAITVMLIGLVNSGIMELKQSIGVIMGSNIGTTMTAWVLSLAGISSKNIIIRLLKPESFSPIIAFIGIIFLFNSKNKKNKNVGTMLIGFAILMSGMSFMSEAVSGLKDEPFFSEVLVIFNNPLLGVAVGALLTAIIQSSSASLGILQSLSLTGGISFGVAIPIILGQNIGTCVTALLSSIGTNCNAKRVTAVHIYFNVIGTTLFLSVFYILNFFVHFSFVNKAITPAGIAVVHTCFNVITTAVLLPFSNQLVKLATFTIKDKNIEKSTFVISLDERLLVAPSLAVSESRNYTIDMAKLVKKNMLLSMDILKNYDKKIAIKIQNNEDIIDKYEDKLGSYLVKISSKNLSENDSSQISILLHTIGDLERIGDHAVNMLKTAKEIYDKKIVFSEKGNNELKIYTNAVKDILSLTINAFSLRDIEAAKRVEPLEQVVDCLNAELRSRHIKRLQGGQCTIELGFILSDILTNYERVSDHCSNIAVHEIQGKNNIMDTHAYLEKIKNSTKGNYISSFNKYKLKYKLPE